jgi:hypothetical protein
MLYLQKQHRLPVLLTLVALALAAPLTLAQQSTQRFGSQQTITFEQRLLAGLRVKTKADARYIERVVVAVYDGTLPVSLVDSAFFYARKRAERSGRLVNNPMIYFRFALEARTRALGIDFP